MKQDRKAWSVAARAAQSKRLKAYWAGKRAKAKPWWQQLLKRLRGAL